MDFSYFLSSYMPDAAYGGKRVYADMLDQALTAEKLGYRGVAIPEHHLINILMVPSPLQMAVKIATLTERIEIMTSVVVLPIRDVRILAGEIIQAHVLCDERLIVGNLLDFDAVAGVLREQLRAPAPPTAIFTANDEFAIAVLHALARKDQSGHGP